MEEHIIKYKLGEGEDAIMIICLNYEYIVYSLFVFIVLIFHLGWPRTGP